MAQIDQIEVTQGDLEIAARANKIWADAYGGPDPDAIAAALSRIASEEAAVLRGVKAGLEAAADAFHSEAITWEQLGPRKSASIRQGVKAILALDPQAIAKETPDAG